MENSIKQSQGKLSFNVIFMVNSLPPKSICDILGYYLIRNFSLCIIQLLPVSPSSIPWHEPANHVPFYMVFFQVFQKSCYRPPLPLCVFPHGYLLYVRCMIKFDDLALKCGDLSHKFANLGDKYINVYTFYMKRNNYVSSKSSFSHPESQA